MATASTPMERAKGLVRQMTIKEKVMELSVVYPMGLLGPDGPIRSELDAPAVREQSRGAPRSSAPRAPNGAPRSE